MTLEHIEIQAAVKRAGDILRRYAPIALDAMHDGRAEDAAAAVAELRAAYHLTLPTAPARTPSALFSRAKGVPVTLILIRGLPGAGKSTLATRLAGWLRLPPPRAADDYFTDAAGRYAFNPAYLPAAHAACQAAVAADLADHGGAVVANTFTQGWEIQPYVKLAQAAGAELVVVDLHDGGLDDAALAARGLHEVPVSAIAAMRVRYEQNWVDADARPPWLRA